MLRYLLLDFDNTLVDFTETERRALRATFRELFARELTDEEVTVYNRINDSYWKKLERKEVDKEQLKRGRFGDFLATLAIETADVSLVNKAYMDNLSKTIVEYPESAETCKRLSERYALYIITNGTTYIQRARLAGCTFAPYIRQMFISDDVGVNKPAPEFFEAVVRETGDADPKHYLVVGDSPSSDIRFGRNIGSPTCYVGTAEADSDYRIGSIEELPALLAEIECYD